MVNVVVLVVSMDIVIIQDKINYYKKADGKHIHILKVYVLFEMDDLRLGIVKKDFNGDVLLVDINIDEIGDKEVY